MSFVRATGMTGRIPKDLSKLQVGKFGVLDEKNRLIGHLPGRMREWIERYDWGEPMEPIDFDWEPGQAWEPTPTEILQQAQFWSAVSKRGGDEPKARAKADELYKEYQRVKLPGGVLKREPRDDSGLERSDASLRREGQMRRPKAARRGT